MIDYLDTPLLHLSGKDATQSGWTLRDSFEGLQIFGGIGSGKTSGSGRMIALKFLNEGYGGLVLTAKPDEKEQWQEFCALTGRSHDLLIVEPGQNNYFNFLDYVSKDGITENIVQVLKTVILAGAAQSGGGSDPFWENALDMLIFFAIDLCKLAYGKVTIPLIYDIVQTIPKPETIYDEDNPTAYFDAFEAAKRNVMTQISQWECEQAPEFLAFFDSEAARDAAVCEAIADARTLKFIDAFFGDTYRNLSERTRSIIDFSFSGFLFRLLQDPVYTLFCSRPTSFTPEHCFFCQKIILINLPVKTYHKIGRDSQIMFKYIWQRAMEKRNLKENNYPVFLWADEAQNFLHEHDAEYQATARSSMIATVYISQNLPNYYANMGGAKSDYKVKSFLGTLATKIFHANADAETNRYASELFGDTYFEETSRSTGLSGQINITKTRSLKIDRAVRPEEFVQLKTGGGLNNEIVEGYMHKQGNPIGEGCNYIKITFDQNFLKTTN